MDSTTETNLTVAAAFDLLREVLPALPTLAGYDEVAASACGDRNQLAGLMVQAIRSGVTQEHEIAALVLATLITSSPATLLDAMVCALETIQHDSLLGFVDTDAAGTALPQIDEHLMRDGLHYTIEEAA